ncbi:MAG: diguanylate cyclase [Spirochaetes bacterium]|nr:diguanylate cyclase [Spirochaetota bacterium]
MIFKKPVTLGNKILFITSLCMILFFFLENIIQFFIFYPEYLRIENQLINNNIIRVQKAFDNEIDHLLIFCKDYAFWDDTYQYVQNQNHSYIQSNYTSDTFIESDFNLIYIINNQQEILYSRIYYPETDVELILKDYYSFGDTFNMTKIMNIPADLDNTGSYTKSGVYFTQLGPIILVSAPVLNSDINLPSVGTLIMGKFIDLRLVEKLNKQTQVDFTISPYFGKREIRRNDPEYQKLIIKSLEFVTDKIQDNFLIYDYYLDIIERPAFLISMNYPHQILDQGQLAIFFAILSLLLLGIMVLFIIILLLRKFILYPISDLVTHIEEITHGSDYTLRLNMNRADEIGHLSNNFDEMMDKIEQQTKKLEQLTIIDSLTNIPNRRKFDEVLNSEWYRHMRFNTSIALILCDIDHFKAYNDYYGHQAGDACLVSVAETLAHSVNRAGDLACRYGGEEFAFILSDTGKEGALIIAARIKEAIEEMKIPHEKSSTSSHVTISMGVTVIIPSYNNNMKDFIEKADQALYQAKKKGRNRIEIKF